MTLEEVCKLANGRAIKRESWNFPNKWYEGGLRMSVEDMNASDWVLAEVGTESPFRNDESISWDTPITIGDLKRFNLPDDYVIASEGGWGPSHLVEFTIHRDEKVVCIN